MKLNRVFRGIVLPTVPLTIAATAAAAQTPGACQPFTLTADERQQFIALADTLKRRSEALAEDAGRLTVPQRRQRRVEIDRTCGTCHARFRIPGGPDDRG